MINLAIQNFEKDVAKTEAIPNIAVMLFTIKITGILPR